MRWGAARLREELARQHRLRLVVDRFLADARTDAEYGSRFEAFAAGWRARTTCAAGYRAATVCGDQAPPRQPCQLVGIVEVCFYAGTRRSAPFWSIFDDAAAHVWAASNHDVDLRLYERLRRTRPDLLRRVEFDSEADFLGVSARFRAPLIAVARVLHRMSLGKPTAPVLGVYEG